MVGAVVQSQAVYLPQVLPVALGQIEGSPELRCLPLRNLLRLRNPGRAAVPAPGSHIEHGPAVRAGVEGRHQDTSSTGCIGVSIDKGTVWGHMVHRKSLVASRYRIRAPQRQRARPLSSNVSMFDMVRLFVCAVFIVIDGWGFRIRTPSISRSCYDVNRIKPQHTNRTTSLNTNKLDITVRMNTIENRYENVLGIYERSIRKLSEREREIAYHFFLQGIAASQLYPELNE